MSNDETRCIKPLRLQETIDNIVAKYADGRSFVRSVFVAFDLMDCTASVLVSVIASNL